MNNRERFNAIMSFKEVDRYQNTEIGLWEQTIDRWRSEDFQKNRLDNSILLLEDDYFGLDTHQMLDIKVLKPYPFIERKILNENGRTYTCVDEFGIKIKTLKAGSVRGMRGFEKFLVDLITRPEIAEMIMEKVFNFHFEVANRAIEATDGTIDIILDADDIGTQNGMILSPELWRKRIKPWTSKLIQSFKKKGYMVAPSNNIQPDTPVENIISLFKTVQEYR